MLGSLSDIHGGHVLIRLQLFQYKTEICRVGRKHTIRNGLVIDGDRLP